jgi:hypothetical protein
MRLCSPTITLFALGIMLLAMNPAAAQESPDFLFGRPSGMIGIRSGWLIASAKGELFQFVQRHLTVERKDFNAPAFGVDVEVAAGRRASAVIGFDFSKSSVQSEYRDFVDNRRLPIEQTTTLREINLSGGVKFAVTPRGREISSRAWIPSAVTPYVGAGAGILHYQFLQFGDFIDVDDPSLSIFTDTIRSDGWTPSAHVLGGVDVKVWKRMYLSGEGRYLWSRANPDRAFSSITDTIDLDGLKLTLGVHYLF